MFYAALASSPGEGRGRLREDHLELAAAPGARCLPHGRSRIGTEASALRS
jgi:hypothetical protein